MYVQVVLILTLTSDIMAVFEVGGSSSIVELMVWGTGAQKKSLNLYLFYGANVQSGQAFSFLVYQQDLNLTGMRAVADAVVVSTGND